MENFKISVDVNINFSNDAKLFLAKLFNTQAPATQAPATQAPTEGEISIDDVRNLLKEKIAKYRQEIKDELTNLGAPSVTKLDKSKYYDLMLFLKNLD